jgi:hypothetical protein
MPKHVGVDNLERINKKSSTTSLSIFWSFCERYYKIVGSAIKRTLLLVRNCACACVDMPMIMRRHTDQFVRNSVDIFGYYKGPAPINLR